MGLGFSVNGKSCGNWSYSGFMSFRERIASSIGIELRDMQGFSKIPSSFIVEHGYLAYREACEKEDLSNKISWDTVNDPIKILLNHSDCDGEIPPEECYDIAIRLEEIIKDWSQKTTIDVNYPNYPSQMTFDDYDVAQAKRLIEGLKQAALYSKPVKFH